MGSKMGSKWVLKQDKFGGVIYLYYICILKKYNYGNYITEKADIISVGC